LRLNSLADRARALGQGPVEQGTLVWTLALGAAGLAFSITTTAAYLPLLLERYTDSGTLIGLILGAEGLFALCVSPIVGPWSDAFITPLGRRRPFMVMALAPMGFFLLLMPFMQNLWLAALIVLSFFGAYYVYETPYRGLYPDLLEPTIYGRAQSAQHILRGAALGVALIGGGLLLKVWSAAPFLLASVVTTGLCGMTILLVREEGGSQRRVFAGITTYVSQSWRIFWGESDVRRFLLANAAWEGAFAAARTFVVLYITVGLGQSKVLSSGVLGAVAAGYVIAAVFAGRLGDRFGLARVIFFASFVYGGGFLVAGLAEKWHDWYFGLIIVVSIAGGTVMTLAWGLLFKLTPAQHRGAISGLATTTKGIGLLCGAPIAGIAHDVAEPYLGSTHGYQIVWPICALLIIFAIPLVGSLISVEDLAANRSSGPAEPETPELVV
jgi:MFS family permease